MPQSMKALRQGAELRQAARDQRSPIEQLAKLEKEGHGDCKEARKLRAQLQRDIDVAQQAVDLTRSITKAPKKPHSSNRKGKRR